MQAVLFEGEEVAVPRAVRLSCACSRLDDRVQVTTDKTIVSARIVAVRHSVLHVRRVEGFSS